jgi:glycosyltransferase involved in cell wall biosynthesis
MSDQAKLTVVIPTHDRAELTTRAVNSVFTSRPELVEVAVVDDCGSIPYEFGRSHNAHGVPVTILRTPLNGGPGLARKFGVQRGSGCAVALLDSDDVFEDGWVDEGLEEVLTRGVERGGVFLAGRVRHGSTVTGALYRVLTAVPPLFQPTATRLAVVMFNPFYTSSVIVSRELCQFSHTLRYCEDYYTNAMALFMAKKIVLSQRFSCSLSRRPGSGRGESANTRAMLLGELGARRAMLSSTAVPVGYKLLVPVGVLYQLIRVFLQCIFGDFWRRKNSHSSHAAS